MVATPAVFEGNDEKSRFLDSTENTPELAHLSDADFGATVGVIKQPGAE